MAGCKILLLLIVFQLVNSKPLLFKEVSIKKNFDFSFKPAPFKPITFIKEKWTKFGHFTAKHIIAKRSPFELAPMPVKAEGAPMFRVSLEKSLDAGPPLAPPPPSPPPTPIPGLLFTPKLPEISPPSPSSPVPLFTPKLPDISPPPPPPPSVLVPMFTPNLPEISSPTPPISAPPPVSLQPPVFITPVQISSFPVEEVIIVTPVPPPPPPVPKPSPSPEVVVPTPILPQVPSPAPVPIPGPPPPVPPPPPVQKGVVQGNMLTDIARVEEINAYLKAVEALGPPPPVEPLLEGNVLPVVTGNSIEAEVKVPPPNEKLNSSPLVKGSRLALYFGNILLQVMSEVISSARSAISQYSQPAPI